MTDITTTELRVFRLSVNDAEGRDIHATEAHAPDLPSALMWAVGSWAPAQGSRRSDGKGFNLHRGLRINGVPLLDALAAHDAALRPEAA